MELLPCPFCGKMNLEIRADLSDDEPSRIFAYHVLCLVCGARGRNNYPIGWCESPEAAAEAWNHRGTIRSLNLEFEEGDLVQIKSGGPVMTIIEKSPVSERFTTAWFASDGNLHTGLFKPTSIRLTPVASDALLCNCGMGNASFPELHADSCAVNRRA